jgi:hypothetical protein
MLTRDICNNWLSDQGSGDRYRVHKKEPDRAIAIRTDGAESNVLHEIIDGEKIQVLDLGWDKCIDRLQKYFHEEKIK